MESEPTETSENRGVPAMTRWGRARGVAFRRGRREAFALATVLVVVAVVASAGILGLGGSGSGPATGSPAKATGTGLPTPPGTGVVARLPTGANATFAWAPDGAHLLVSDGSGSRVYDRFGKLISEFAPVEGWLDAGHLIGGDGYVADISHSHTGLSPADSRVVANGHGSAAIIVTRSACGGDPVVDWYRDGHYVRAQETVTPFGWSPDGEDVVLGHMACDPADGVDRGAKGPVQLVDFASGRVLATLPDVRGEMAFSPDGESLAAQSDSDLNVVEIDSGGISTVPGIRFLGWLDVETIFAASGSRIEFVDLDPPDVSPVAYAEWQAVSPEGIHLSADLSGRALRVSASDGTVLLDLSSAGLVAERYPAAGEPVVSALQPSWWSPDGGMLALESSDGTSLVMLSVDPSRPAR
jgi:WD40 repeat protein